MDPIIQKLIDQLNTSVFVLLLLMVAIGYLLVKAGEWSSDFKHNHKRINDLEGISERVVSLEANTNKSVQFGERIIKIETVLDLIYQRVAPNPFAQAKSPISLTKDGDDIASKINVEKTISRIYPDLIELINKKSPRTAYDIQECAFTAIRENILSLLSETEINVLKNEAFNKGMPVDSFYIIYGVILRDRILQERKIPISDVDLHDPTR